MTVYFIEERIHERRRNAEIQRELDKDRAIRQEDDRRISIQSAKRSLYAVER